MITELASWLLEFGMLCFRSDLLLILSPLCFLQDYCLVRPWITQIPFQLHNFALVPFR